MSRFPSDSDIDVANALLGKLLARGNNPQLQADGLINLGGPVTDREEAWAKANRDAMQSALVGSGRYVKGTLDRIYGITPSDENDLQQALQDTVIKAA